MHSHPTVPKPSILIFIEYYQPGYRFGGPIQAVANLVTLLRDEYDLFIVARDRDVGDRNSFAKIPLNAWLKRDGYTICYLPPRQLTNHRIGELLAELPDALVYSNSLFSIFTRHLLVNSLKTRRQILIAPRGELHPGALRLKAWKKRPYLELVRRFCSDFIRWHATSVEEKRLIQRWFRVTDEQVGIALDLPTLFASRPTHHKQAGQLKLVWLARLAPNKGLRFLLECLSQMPTGPVQLAIYGPVADGQYWRNCQRLISGLSHRHQVTYHGEVPYTDVRETLLPHDFLVLPTAGENFGHVIAESLSLGLPVLISDQTPWRNMHLQRAGRDLPLQRNRWVNLLTTCFHMDTPTYVEHTQGATATARQLSDREASLAEYNHLFTATHSVLCPAVP